jgi:glucose/arabinose dehydrogenase
MKPRETASVDGISFGVATSNHDPQTLAVSRSSQKDTLSHEARERGPNTTVSPSEEFLLMRLSLCVCFGLLASLTFAADVNETPLNVQVVPAFTDVSFTGWEPDINGKPSPLRPILLTHLGDGTNRVCVPQQQGQIHVFDNKSGAQETKVLLDISKKVTYKDNQNEEGFLGMAFHPKFKENGHFYVFYSPSDTPLMTVISRFTLAKGEASKADPASEQVLFRFNRPFWNHDGGTLCFGPDGYLYIVIGDGGAGNDPFNNAQNLQTHLGKILRVDVDKSEDGKPYGIPKDNPFVGVSAPGVAANKKTAIVKPEIYAYGLRNVWRMSFDRATGQGWVADVGQNVWEEINLLQKGGNYGWNLREGKHVFMPSGEGTLSTLIDPIWEYHHDIGKSITGGYVYRGKEVPELTGYYLYADYVSGRVWALKYDPKTKSVVENRPIQHGMPSLPVISFGEDEAGEVYFTIVAANGKGIYKFAKK